MNKLELNLTDGQKELLKKLIKENRFIYQGFTHVCGWHGNRYQMIENKWHRRESCPQCEVKLEN